ncbi:MAG: OpgC domain-containing protein [Methylocapsa sp.]|nr:OpgC domain-containing protein [Methylocapsa sp.]
MRGPNEIDFWRGFALVTIFINHIPGIYYERFTFRNVSLSDSAELFVFLAGWAVRKLTDGKAGALPAKWLVLRLESRAFQVYIAQLAVTEFAVALLAAASLYLDAPFLLDWHNASAIFNDPVEAQLGLVLLTHQLGYFNILPLYVVLIFLSPVVVLLHRASKLLLLLVSLAVYMAALLWGVNLPTWPVEGSWFFNPLSWQLIYVLGFLFAGETGPGKYMWGHRRALRFLALPLVLLGAAIGLTGFSPDSVLGPDPKLVLSFSKTFLAPARLIHFLSLAMFFAGAFPLIARWLPGIPGYLCLLGRNSLIVFCILSLLSLCAQIFRYVYGGSLTTDSLIAGCGLFFLGFAAWAGEWRDRMQRELAGKPLLL